MNTEQYEKLWVSEINKIAKDCGFNSFEIESITYNYERDVAEIMFITKNGERQTVYNTLGSLMLNQSFMVKLAFFKLCLLEIEKSINGQ